MTSDVFEKTYAYLFDRDSKSLSHSPDSKRLPKELYLAGSTIITVFKENSQGKGRKRLDGQPKGGIIESRFSTHTYACQITSILSIVSWSVAPR